jgi:hypothetical protein
MSNLLASHDDEFRVHYDVHWIIKHLLGSILSHDLFSFMCLHCVVYMLALMVHGLLAHCLHLACLVSYGLRLFAKSFCTCVGAWDLRIARKLCSHLISPCGCKALA